MSENTKEYEAIRIEKTEGVTFLMINRPEKRNAMSPQVHLEMEDAIDMLATDNETKVLVITGAGDEAFSAGQDLKLTFRDLDKRSPAEDRRLRAAAFNWRYHKIASFPKPTIAMINGFCMGGAFTQACATDFAIAADEALFALSEVNWGIIPGGMVAWNVVQVMNFRDAMYYAVTGDTFTGQEAKTMGVVNKSVPRAQLKAAVMELAKKLMQKSPLAVKYTKDSIRAVRYMNEPQATDYLNAKSDALKWADRAQNNREKAMSQFLDEKSFRPGFGSMRVENS